MDIQTLVKEICPTTTQKWIKNGALLVDVRERDEVAQLAFNVPAIINIPLSEFEERFNEVPKDKQVVMVCKVGVRSLRTAGFLINHGWDKEKIMNMQYGIVRWVQKGFPTIGDTSSIAKNESDGCCNSTSTETKTNASCCESTDSNGSSCC